MLKLIGLLLYFVTVVIFPIVLIVILALLGKLLAKYYQAMIHPNKISEKVADNIFGVWFLSLFVTWIATLWWMAANTHADVADLLAFRDKLLGYQATTMHITLAKELDERLVEQVLEPWVRMGGREIRRRVSRYSSARYGGRGRIVRYISTAYIPSRYRQVDQQLEIVMGKELSSKWLWMLEKGWRSRPMPSLLPNEIAAQLTFKGQTETIYLQPFTASYEEHLSGQCHLKVTANIPARSFAYLWVTRKTTTDKHTSMPLQLHTSWPGNIYTFQLDSIVADPKRMPFSLRQTQEIFYLRPLNQNGRAIHCTDLQQLESSALAGISLRNHLTYWDELRPYIKDLHIKNSHFVPWLAGRGWQILSEE